METNATTPTPATITLPVTVRGITRDVEFRLGNYGRAHSGPVFTGNIGRGSKTHRLDIMAVAFEDRATAGRMGYRGTNLVELDGQVWGIKLEGVVLNRTCAVTGWAEDAAATSRHIMEG